MKSFFYSDSLWHALQTRNQLRGSSFTNARFVHYTKRNGTPGKVFFGAATALALIRNELLGFFGEDKLQADVSRLTVYPSGTDFFLQH